MDFTLKPDDSLEDAHPDVVVQPVYSRNRKHDVRIEVRASETVAMLTPATRAMVRWVGRPELAGKRGILLNC